ncbi:hypothetical protein COB21_03120 [Candidatus Aerophobetes bacterium]|uniref:DUF1186 domain-containing protein n=1 Tax=Aerophobetes bacterium TaxID=2030807 RepID=A0A2A4X475_UNCAE|nr:MAG: hypothetical protein COB21_03120 [Candidatus Aerophobetes bacterium]
MDTSDTPIVNTLDMEILLHRDCHFSSLFDEMITYYKKESVGTMPDFDVEEIEKLFTLEQKLGKDLSSIYLNEASYEIIRSCKDMYARLRDIYDSPSPDPQKVLISDLILSEEEYPEKTIAAILLEKELMLPLLFPLLSSSHFYSPLYPGYGRVPALAATILGKIQDSSAIPHLFNAMVEDNFFTDDAIILALVSFGDQTLDFLLPKLKGKPFSNDNERAAIVLSSFPETDAIGKICLQLLEKTETLSRPMFSSYLIFSCGALKGKAYQDRFKALSHKPGLSLELKQDIKIIVKNFQKP